MKNKISALLGAMMFLAAIQSARAGNATWNLSPSNGDWNTAANWTPNTIPNGPLDLATFDLSNQTTLSLSATTEVNGITFNPGASGFTTIVPDTQSLTISGAGLTNNSGIVQNFVTPQAGAGVRGGSIQFRNNATAGSDTTLTINGDSSNLGVRGPFLTFYDNSSAGGSSIVNNGNGPLGGGFRGGITIFKGNSSAASASIINNPSQVASGFGGSVEFHDDSTAATATLTNKGGLTFVHAGAGGGYANFYDTSSAGHATFINEGSPNGSSNGGGNVYFSGTSTAGAATFLVEGSPIRGGNAAGVSFSFGSHAGNAIIVATSGGERYALGGLILFRDESHGDTAQIRLFGNATLDVSYHYLPGLTLGSVDGEGRILLGDVNLAIGANNLNTTISGLIQDGGLSFGSGGSLTKTGRGELILTFANTYTGGTRIERGQLTVNNTIGSGTGTGPVEVRGGILAGKGIVAGAVTAGAGTGPRAVLSPGAKGGLGTLTIQNTLVVNANANYNCAISSSRSASDQMVAAGVTINSGAALSLVDTGTTVLPPGTVFTILSNTAATPIAGTFGNFPDDSTVTIGGNTYQIDYEGGDGNDLTLTVVP